MALHRYLLVLALLPALLAPVSSQGDPLYSVSFVPLAHFTPYDMNNAGQVVGTRAYNAILYDGLQRVIGIPDAESAYAYGINDAGAITGVYLSRSDNFAHAFVYQDGNLRDLGRDTAGYGINAQGDVVGVTNSATGTTGFVDRNGTLTELGNLGAGNYGQARGINAYGQIVGDSTLSAGLPDAARHPFLYSNGTLQDLGTLGQRDNNSAVAINDAGQIAGYSDATDGTTHAFLYEDGVMRDLGGFGTSQMEIHNINAHGAFVGTAITGAAGDVPFISLNGALADLNTLIDPALGWALYAAYANNDLDQIIDSGCFEHVCGLVRLDLLSAVPEPDVTWMLASGLLVLALAMPRRRPRRGTLFTTA